MPRTVSEDKCVSRAEAARRQVNSLSGKGGIVKTSQYTGISGATPYNRRKGK